MNNKFVQPVFWILLVISVVTMSLLLLGTRGHIGLWFLIFILIVVLLAVALIILAARAKVNKILKSFLILTGSSVMGFFLSILLHNLIYGLLIRWFGLDFWSRTRFNDEPFFFTMAVVICPIAYLVGSVGSIVFMIKSKVQKKALFSMSTSDNKPQTGNGDT